MLATETPAITETLPRKKFTRGEVRQMMDAGLFAGQRFELIHGDLVDKMGQNPPHAAAIRRLERVLRRRFGEDRVQAQLPVELSGADREWSEPEPDLAVLDAAADRFETRHPMGSEVLLLVEVADSSLLWDCTGKRDLYARAQVREYWVLDLNGRRLIVHRNPVDGAYQTVDHLTPGQATESNIAVSDLFPA
jgi:Uma2 family endonuclease